jgi:hypothetical protein
MTGPVGVMMAELQTIALARTVPSAKLGPAEQGSPHIALSALATGTNAVDDKAYKVETMVGCLCDISNLQSD